MSYEREPEDCILTSLEEEIAGELEPTPLERILAERYAQLLIKILESHPRISIDALSVEVHGSYAKDTWLSKDFDLDIFVIYPKEKRREWVRTTGFNQIREAIEAAGIPYLVEYAEHPYITTIYLGLEANIVPALEPGGERLSVYRTTRHTRYIRQHLKPWQKRHVRLLKSFLKATGTYGADSETQGVSGYLAELLILIYKCFPKAIGAIASWNPPLVIDPKTGKHRKPGYRQGEHPVVIPDPVDPGRNAAAALSLETLGKLVLAARAYINKPCQAFFHTHTSRTRRIKPPQDRAAIIHYYNPTLHTLPRDTIWGELHRIRRTIVRLLENLGYKVVYSSAATDESAHALIGVEVYNEKPSPEPRSGPQPWRGDPIKFITKTLEHNMPFWTGIDGTLWAWRPRPRRLHEELETRWREYTVAPHFRDNKPRIYAWGKQPHHLSTLVSGLEERMPPWTKCLNVKDG